MIPEKIHYVWFNGKPLPKQMQKCINTWKKVLPNYEIICCNENSFDINSIPALRHCYEIKHFSKISEYLRLYALYTEGGIIYYKGSVPFAAQTDFNY
ncbi:MAG: hypothetical protein LBS50_04890 [Prevotellaceae bacterium]|jgi:mannosyltransferase OCH1-like enzyme|nr:hypothetical protein [Prevotellaceae bacterium]